MTKSHESKVESQRIERLYSVTSSFQGLWIGSRLDCYYLESLAEQDSCVCYSISVHTSLYY